MPTSLTPPHILLIDDDQALSGLLSEYLQQQGFTVHAEYSGEAGLAYLDSTSSVDLIILDIMLPGQNGLAVLKQLRAIPSAHDLPVIMLTARGDDIDRIVGLELGADDYMAKPAHPRELLARIQAVLRRMTQQQISPTHDQATMLQTTVLSIDHLTRIVQLHGTTLSLTSAEFDVLSVLMRQANESAGQPVSKTMLYREALGREQDPYDRALDVHVSNLRKKLADNSIKTIRGVGYQFTHVVTAVKVAATT